MSKRVPPNAYDRGDSDTSTLNLGNQNSSVLQELQIHQLPLSSMSSVLSPDSQKDTSGDEFGSLSDATLSPKMNIKLELARNTRVRRNSNSSKEAA